MSERNPFGKRPADGVSRQNPGGTVRCEEWEAMLADALDGLLTPTEGAAFDGHSQECKLCAQLLAEAKQGQEWMQFLHVEPEMPSDMMEKILNRTSRAVSERPLAIHGAPIPVGPSILHLPRRRMVWDTRMMMTAAMAFFSIALTLNLTGIRLSGIRLADLTPAKMQNTLSRQLWDAKGSVVRYYDGLRFVYELESKLRELRRDEDTEKSAPAPAGGGEQQQQRSTPNKNGGKGEALPPVFIQPGQQVLALNNQERDLIGSPTDQAERSLA